MALLFSACVVDEDTTIPTINSIKVNGALAEEHPVNAGSTISVAVDAADNNRLEQVKVEIHAADDGHTHDGLGADEVDHPNSGVWGETEIDYISGTSDVETFSFDIPDSIGGRWHVKATVLDANGNESDDLSVTLLVQNANLPVFDITGTNPPLNSDGEMDVALGNAPEVMGTVSDADGLAQIIATLLEDGNAEQTIDIDPLGNNSFGLSAITFTDPAAGQYILQLYARDTEGYYSLWEFVVHVE